MAVSAQSPDSERDLEPTSRDLVREHVYARRQGQLFHDLAAAEPDAAKSALYQRISDNEQRLADLLRDRLQQDAPAPGMRWSPTATLLGIVARVLPAASVGALMRRRHHRWLSSNHAMLADDAVRTNAVDTAEALDAVVYGSEHDRGHAEVGWLASKSGTIRAAVLGLNDGLVSNFSLTMGIAGATSDASIVLVAGLAGLLAGALSMAAGEYVSVRSQNEYYANLVRWERTELMLWADEEQSELAQIYVQKGLSETEAATVSARIMSDPAAALDTHVREELGIDPEELGGSPWAAAISSLIAFAIGAFVPITPYLFGAADVGAIAASASASLIALGTVGGALAWISGINVWKGAARMVAIGCVAAAITFVVGFAVGTGVPG